MLLYTICMSERMPRPAQILKGPLWKAESVTPENQKNIIGRGIVENEEELKLALNKLQQTLHLIPYSMLRFRERENGGYQEFTIKIDNADTRYKVIEALEGLGLMPWYEPGDAELIVNHPKDIELIHELGLTGKFQVERMAEKERSGEPEIITQARQKVDAEFLARGAATFRPSQFSHFPTPTSGERTLYKKLRAKPTEEQIRMSKERVNKMSVPEREEEIEKEADIELSEIIDRFDLGWSEEEIALMSRRNEGLPTLDLFPYKYIWFREEKEGRKRMRRRHCWDVREEKIIDEQERHEMRLQAKTDPEALRSCVEMNLGLVLSRIPYFLDRHQNAEPDDLLQVGIMGLLSAFKNYTSEDGKGWSGYALQYIEQGMHRYLSDNVRLIRKPSHTDSNRGAYFKAQRALESDRPSKAVERREMAESLYRTGALKVPSDLALDRFERRLEIERIIELEPTVLDIAYGSKNVSMTGAPLVSQDSPEDALHKKELIETINQILQTLTPREERVLRMRFGMGVKEHTLEEVAETYGVTRERIRGIETKALSRLRHPARSRALLKFEEKN